MRMTSASARRRMMLTRSSTAISVVDQASKCFSPSQINLIVAGPLVTLIKKKKEIHLKCQNIATSDSLCFKTITLAKVKVSY